MLETLVPREPDDLRALVAAHPLAALVEDGRIVRISQGWAERLGRDPTGEAAEALAPASAAALARVLGGGTADLELGTSVVRVTGVARAGGAVLTGVDVGDRERAGRRAEALLRDVGSTLARTRHRLAEAQAIAQVGSFELDPTTHAMTWSPGMYELVGLPPDTDVSDATAFSGYVHADDLDAVRSWFWSSPGEGERRLTEFRIVRADGAVRWVRAALTTDRAADGRTLICGSARDVTAERGTAAELARVRDDAQRAIREHTQFLGALSHELRTPVAGVIGLIDLAVAARDPLAAERDLRSASAAARHLLGVIDDLLLYARVESGQIELDVRDFDLADVVAESVAVVSANARGKGLAIDTWLSPDLPRWRRGDPLRVRQVLVNLLGNAVKFTEHGGVALAVAPGRDAGEVTLRVDDTGVGIAPEKLGQVFEPFVQGEAGRRFGGTGLGLAIARELVARMHGRMEVASTPGAGTHFTLTLALPEGTPQAVTPPPRRRPSASEAPPAPLAPRATPPHRLRVLVADDTDLVRDVVARVVGAAGHDAVAVGDGDAAIAAALRDRFDLVLMDLSMPGTDGLAATRRIRAEARARGLPRVPIIALTASVDDEARALAAGMDDYLVKPVDVTRLASLCESVAAGGVAAPVDREAFVDRVGGSAQLAADVAQLFVAKRDELVKNVRDAVAGGDVETIARAAHGVKGALAMVAAGPAVAAAADLEAAAGDAQRRGPLCARLAREIARAAAELSLGA
jgi:PAS domain S-box-containing protein